MRSAATLALLLALGLAAPALGQVRVPVKVTADVFQLNDATQEATFSGNVVIVRSGMTMWAENVLVTYGSGGQSDIDQLVATGNVRIETDGQKATGRRATFDPDTQILRLTEDVTVVNSSGTVTGPELTINLADNTSVFRGGDGDRVTGVFLPQ